MPGLWSWKQTLSNSTLIHAAARADAAKVNALLASPGADGITTDGSLQWEMPFDAGNSSTWMLAEFQSAQHPRTIEAEGGGRGDDLNLTTM